MFIFVDETGDHNLNTIDKEYPVFGLGALLVDEDVYRSMETAVNDFKSRYFENYETFILHSAELKRPTHKKSDPRNKIMLDKELRQRFFEDFDSNILKSFNFSLVFCYIRKYKMVGAYHYPADPYHFSFENILNRVIRHGAGTRNIFAEKRGEELNAELEAEYQRLSKTGIHFFDANTVATSTNLTLVDKKANINGLQVIDLALSAMTRDLQGKREKMLGNDCTVELLRSKLACPVTIFPYKR